MEPSNSFDLETASGPDRARSRSFVGTMSSFHERRVQIALEVLQKAREEAVTEVKEMDRFSSTAAHPLRHLWKRPQLRKLHGGSEERGHGALHEHWIELFNDLVMVAMLSNLSHLFEAGGRKVTNHAMITALWVIMLQSMQFVTFAINLWSIDDLFQLVCCFCVTLGTVLMAASVKSGVHPPCTAQWYKSPTYVQRFDMGVLVSQISQIVFALQAALFDAPARNIVAIMLTCSCGEVLCIMCLDGFAKYFVCATIVAMAYVVSWKFTNAIELLDLPHLRGRADLMVLVSLGEWVITTILKNMTWQSLVSQTSLDLMLAAEYFNTRLHGSDVMSLAMSSRSTVDLLYLEALEFALQYGIAICLLFLPASVGISLDAADDDDHHSRLLSEECPLDSGPESGWNRQALTMNSASFLCATRLCLLILRHIRKSKIQQVNPGNKFYLRVGLCFAHLGVPWMTLLAWGEDRFEDLPFGSMYAMHAVLVFVDVVAELSIHRLAAKQVREWRSAVAQNFLRT
mmetsp:Transcript_8045/g.18796  ORF Transcript_8045/g.18796 Transcript_8045/m.18796 type:complete len:514 (-) Transcript_8045:56-1597(-)